MVSATELDLPVPTSEMIAGLPEGAVSIEMSGSTWVLRASRSLQERFEQLLELRKQGLQTEQDRIEYDAICGLDQLLSGFNCLARRLQ